MRCLNCKYDLRDLAEHRCPECGRIFDPADPQTYQSLQLSGELGRFCITAAAVMNIYPLLILASIAIALAGRWSSNSTAATIGNLPFTLFALCSPCALVAHALFFLGAFIDLVRTGIWRPVVWTLVFLFSLIVWAGTVFATLISLSAVMV